MSNIPGINNNIGSLWEPFRAKVELLLKRMTNRGYDAVVFEAARSLKRQQYLYSIGRTRDKNRKPVTWTMHSRHLMGKAADIISKRRGWNWPEFYEALLEEVAKIDELKSLAPREMCHIEWHG